MLPGVGGDGSRGGGCVSSCTLQVDHDLVRSPAPAPQPHMQLEEFKLKKQQALAKKPPSAATSPSKPPAAPAAAPDGSSDLPPGQPSERPPGLSVHSGAATAAPAVTNGEAESLRQQVGELLSGMDDLHRALQEERLNSGQLEQQLQEQQARLRELLETNAALQAAASAAAAPAAADPHLQQELEEARAQAQRYAQAAESLSAELAAAQEAAAAEAAAVEEAKFAQIAEYKQREDEAAEALAAAQAGSQRSEDQLVALSTQLAQQQEEMHALQVGRGGWSGGWQMRMRWDGQLHHASPLIHTILRPCLLRARRLIWRSSGS